VLILDDNSLGCVYRMAMQKSQHGAYDWCASVVCARTDDANVICASLLGTEVATDFDWWTLHSLWQQLKANLLLKASQVVFVETVESAHRSSFRFCLEFNQVFPFARKLKTYVPHSIFLMCCDKLKQTPP